MKFSKHVNYSTWIWTKFSWINKCVFSEMWNRFLPVGRDSALETRFFGPRVHRKCIRPTKRRQRPNNVAHPLGFPVHGSTASQLPVSCVSSGLVLQHAPIQSRRFSTHSCCWRGDCRAWCRGEEFAPSEDIWVHGGSDRETLWCDRQISVGVRRWFYEGPIGAVLLSHICGSEKRIMKMSNRKMVQSGQSKRKRKVI